MTKLKTFGIAAALSALTACGQVKATDKQPEDVIVSSQGVDSLNFEATSTGDDCKIETLSGEAGIFSQQSITIGGNCNPLLAAAALSALKPPTPIAAP